MKTAVLYVRVSTEEQASRGYSLRSQQEILTNYCDLNGICILKIFIEDYSAKNFKRPEWAKLITYLRKQKPVLLMFTRWDRFSRNTGEAYQMIANLKNMGTNPHAVEQPLDLNIPENKLMLALYLAAPEIENDRPGLNTKMGIRRAKKEGHWAGKAPLGYKNRIAEDGKKYITPQEPYASVIKRAFNELSQGIFSISEIYRRSIILGLNCSISNFYRTIRNPIYCGKIKVKAFEGEEEQEIRGLHEALISEKIFNKVQDMLKGNLKPKRSAIATPDDLQLRDFLQCPDCGRKLTGSASKGRNTHVAYYHCNSPCKIRFNAKQLNMHFLEELKLFKLNKDDWHN